MILPIRIWLDPCHQCPAEPMAAYPKSKDFHRFSSYICSILHLNPHLDSNYIYIYIHQTFPYVKKIGVPYRFPPLKLRKIALKPPANVVFLKNRKTHEAS